MLVTPGQLDEVATLCVHALMESGQLLVITGPVPAADANKVALEYCLKQLQAEPHGKQEAQACLFRCSFV